jgi:hypothetical protein
MAEDDKSEISLDDLLADLLGTPEQREKYAAARSLRLENPWVLDLIKVLYPHPAGLRRSIVIHSVLRNRKARGQSLPGTSDETIQSALQQYCVHAAAFKNRKAPVEDGIFHWPKGPRTGVWAIYPDKAQAWLKRHGIRC